MPRIPDLPPDELRPGDRITTHDDTDLIPALERVERDEDRDEWVVHLPEGQGGPFRFTADHRLTVERAAT